MQQASPCSTRKNEKERSQESLYKLCGSISFYFPHIHVIHPSQKFLILRKRSCPHLYPLIRPERVFGAWMRENPYSGIHSVPCNVSHYNVGHSLHLGETHPSARMGPEYISHSSLVIVEEIINSVAYGIRKFNAAFTLGESLISNNPYPESIQILVLTPISFRFLLILPSRLRLDLPRCFFPASVGYL